MHQLKLPSCHPVYSLPLLQFPASILLLITSIQTLACSSDIQEVLKSKGFLVTRLAAESDLPVFRLQDFSTLLSMMVHGFCLNSDALDRRWAGCGGGAVLYGMHTRCLSEIQNLQIQAWLA